MSLTKKFAAMAAAATILLASANNSKADIIDFMAQGTVTDAAGIVVGTPFELSGIIDTDKVEDALPNIDTIGQYNDIFQEFSLLIGAGENQGVVLGKGGQFLVGQNSGGFRIDSDDAESQENLSGTDFSFYTLAFEGVQTSGDGLMDGLNILDTSEEFSNFTASLTPASASGGISNVTVSTRAVPEPGSEAALIAAGIALAAIRRRGSAPSAEI